MILRITIQDVGQEKVVDLRADDGLHPMMKSWRSDGPIEMAEVVKLLPKMIEGLWLEMVKT